MSANDPTVRGGSTNPFTMRKSSQAGRHRLGEPAAVHQPGRVGGRRSPHPIRDLHPRGPRLPGPDPTLRGGAPHHLPGVRELDRRGRLCPRHERLHRDDRGPLEGVPRWSSPRQDGHRRGVRRRVTRRRRDARPGERARRLPGGRRARRHPTGTRHRGPAQLAQARPRSDHGQRRAALRPRRAPRRRLGRPPGPLRSARRAGPGRRRFGVRRVQTPVRAEPGHRMGLHPRLSDRGPGQPPRRAVQRGVEQGHPIHPAGQSDRRPPAVPPEHDRLHGGKGVRAARASSRTGPR